MSEGGKVIDFPASTRFLIRERLGSGGMGEVFRAYDNERRAEVALKVLRTSDPTALYMFKREFRSLADVNHENLVQFHDLVSAEDTWFLTMEFVDGVDFLQYVKHGYDAEPEQPAEKETRSAGGTMDTETSRPLGKHFRQLPTNIDDEGDTSILSAKDLGFARSANVFGPEQLERLRDGLRQLAGAVNALHDVGRLHRDIKPTNILVTRSGRLVLLDFGVMSDLAAPDDHGPSIVGTPLYMSPEQAAGRALSPASDWYSVGVVVYEALTGRRPFGGALPQIIEAKKRLAPPSPRQYAPDTPKDLDELCRRLLAPRAQDRPDGADVLRMVGADPARAETVGAHGEATVLLGREQQRVELRKAFNAVVQGTATVVLVDGAAGMGKTALIQDFVNEMKDNEGAVVLSGRCYETESVPYKALDPLMDALCRYLLSLPQRRMAATTSFNVMALARLFPVLRRVQALVGLSGHDEPTPSHELRRRGIQALRDLLYTLSADAPIILHIDDLHWGDLDSAALLKELLRPPGAPPIMLIGSFRTSERHDNPFFNALLPLPCDVREIYVDPLSSEETRSLVETMIGEVSQVLPALVNSLARESSGNPFFVHELVRYVRAEAFDDMSIGAISLDEVVRARIKGLLPKARALLNIVAVAGRPIREPTARRAADFTEEDAVEVTLLKQRNLIRTRAGQGRDLLEPFHDRIGALTVEDLGAEELQSCHRRLAIALSLEENPDLEALAEHYDAAGESERATVYWVAAGKQAQRALAFDHAASLFERAVSSPALPESLRLDSLSSHAQALSDAGRGAGAAKAYIRAAESATPAEALEFRRIAAENLLRSGHIDEGVQLLESVLKAIGFTVPRPGFRSVVSLLLRRARLRVSGLRYKLADESEITPALLRRIDVCWSAATGLVMADHIRSADFQTRHILLALKAGEAHRLARAFVVEAGIVSTGGAKARRRCERILEMADEVARLVPASDVHGWIPGVRGLSAYQCGDFKLAREMCEQALEILSAHELGMVFEWTSLQLYTLWALYYLGEAKEIRERVFQLVAEAESRGDIYSEVNFSTSLNVLAWLVGDEVEEATARLDKAMAQWSQSGYHLQHYWEMIARVQILMYKGDNEVAWRTVSEAWADLRRSFLPRVQVVRIEAWATRGRAALAGGDAPALLREAKRASKKVRRERLGWALSLADLLDAGIAARRGDEVACLEYLESAQAGFATSNMKLYAAAARWCRGKRLEGTEGEGLVAHAEQWMAEQGIVAPEKIVRMLAPGLS